MYVPIQPTITSSMTFFKTLFFPYCVHAPSYDDTSGENPNGRNRGYVYSKNIFEYPWSKNKYYVFHTTFRLYQRCNYFPTIYTTHIQHITKVMSTGMYHSYNTVVYVWMRHTYVSKWASHKFVILVWCSWRNRDNSHFWDTTACNVPNNYIRHITLLLSGND